MNIDERLKQNELDISKLEETRKELLKQKKEAETPKPRHGDVFYCTDFRTNFILMKGYSNYPGWRVYDKVAGGRDWTEQQVIKNYSNGTWKVRGNIFNELSLEDF